MTPAEAELTESIRLLGQCVWHRELSRATAVDESLELVYKYKLHQSKEVCKFLTTQRYDMRDSDDLTMRFYDTLLQRLKRV